jgi:hypothetical protein
MIVGFPIFKGERLREADERRFAPLERRPVAAAPRGRLVH